MAVILIVEDEATLLVMAENILNIGVFVMAETFSLMTKPKPEHVINLININRAIAAGLSGSAKKDRAQEAA